MKKILAVLFCSLVVTLTGCVNAPFKIDPVATAKAPWKVGEKIVDEGICSWDNYYREFLGVNKSGLALVQEFYLSGEKFTDPFLMPIKNADKNEVSSCRENIEGVYTTRYKNGQKRMESHYKHGKRDGFVTEWYENGQKKAESRYENDSLEGLRTEWHENGQKEAEANYKNDQIEGLVTTWYKNGQKWMEGNMKSDKWVGIMRFWDEKGNLIEEKDYGIPED